MDNRFVFYDEYVQILREELVPAMGCTEPIAIAYAGSVARDTLGVQPDRVTQICCAFLRTMILLCAPEPSGVFCLPIKS